MGARMELELTLDHPGRVGDLAPGDGAMAGVWACGLLERCCWVSSVTYPLPHGALGARLPPQSLQEGGEEWSELSEGPIRGSQDSPESSTSTSILTLSPFSPGWPEVPLGPVGPGGP